MSKKMVECIPNFSEARRPDVVEQIAQAILSVNGVQILDRHSDQDHNRTVITLLGEPQAVEQPYLLAFKRRRIDRYGSASRRASPHWRHGRCAVRAHREMEMSECVEMARRLAKRVGEELGFQVYLYEEAAARPDRVNLEDVRRGQYEGLKEEVKTNAERKPDFGPAELGKAGATVHRSSLPADRLQCLSDHG